MAAPFKIFIVEDDTAYAQLLAFYLGRNADYELHRFTTGKEALAKMHKKPNLVTLDYTLPDLDGTQVLRKMLEASPETDVIIISGQDEVSTAVQLLKLGAYDYIQKTPDTFTQLSNSIQNAREKQALRRQVDKLRQEVTQKYQLQNLIKGQSAAIQRIIPLIEKAARTNIPVSVFGEAGTGKGMVAKAIHYNSPRHHEPLVLVDLSTVPQDYFETELFGYEQGAWPGASHRRIGRIEESNGGTLFINAIQELDGSLQAKLLRVIVDKQMRRLGSSTPIPIDLRLVVASNRNLAEEVLEGNFREDLFYRLMGITIPLAPLRERGVDTLILAKAFMEDFARENRLRAKPLTEAAKEKILSYAWPGNTSELRAVVEAALTLSEGPEITEADIVLNVPSPTALEDTTKPLAQIEREVIAAAVRRCKGNVLKAAEVLQISKSKIYQLIKAGEVVV